MGIDLSVKFHVPRTEFCNKENTLLCDQTLLILVIKYSFISVYLNVNKIPLSSYDYTEINDKDSYYVLRNLYCYKLWSLLTRTNVFSKDDLVLSGNLKNIFKNCGLKDGQYRNNY